MFVLYKETNTHLNTYRKQLNLIRFTFHRVQVAANKVNNTFSIPRHVSRLEYIIIERYDVYI